MKEELRCALKEDEASARLKYLTQDQESLLRELSFSPIEISDLKDRIEDVRILLNLGLARLVFVERVWGTELLVEGLIPG